MHFCKQMTSPPPVAQVAPVPRNNAATCPEPPLPQQASVISQTQSGTFMFHSLPGIASEKFSEALYRNFLSN